MLEGVAQDKNVLRFYFNFDRQGGGFNIKSIEDIVQARSGLFRKNWENTVENKERVSKPLNIQFQE